VGLREPEGAIAAAFGEVQLLIGLDEALIIGPGPEPERCELSSPAAIREKVRFDNDGRYRPLSGLRNLPHGWHARFTSLEAFSEGVDAVYPLAQRHAALHASGELAVISLDEVLGRQRGRYQVAKQISPAGRALVERALCSVCVREPVWNGTGHVSEGGIPCPEPCSVVLSLCREVAIWEQVSPARAEPDPSVPFAAFEEPGNQVREACLRVMEAQRG
jgi:hypothetical protein